MVASAGLILGQDFRSGHSMDLTIVSVSNDLEIGAGDMLVPWEFSSRFMFNTVVIR